MKFKKNFSQIIDRNRLLWSGQFSNRILAKIDIGHSATMRMWEKVLSPEYCPDYVKMFDFFYDEFSKRENLLDDAMPTARPNIGDYAFGAYLGAEVIFAETGGYSKPFLKNLKDMASIKYNKENKWISWLMAATRYFAEKSQGLFATSIIETMDSLNFAENAYGSNAYIEINDHPKEMLEIFELAMDFNIKLIEEQRMYIKAHNGGYFDLHEEWLPGNCIWLSVDSWGNCSIETFKKYGKLHLQKIIDYFGYGWIHMHSSHLHLLQEISKVNNILGIGILDDPGSIKCFDIIKDIKRNTKGLPLQINCNKNQFLEALKIKELPGNIMYWIDSGINDITEANNIMDMVYEYKA